MRRVLIFGGHEDGDRRERTISRRRPPCPPEDVDRTASVAEALRLLATGDYDLCIIDDRSGGTAARPCCGKHARVGSTSPPC